MIRVLIILFLFGFTGQVLAQNQNLALQYYRSKEFSKAVEELEDVYKKNKSFQIYDALLDSYQQLKQFDEAEKLIKKQIKIGNGSLLLEIDRGHNNYLSGNESEAEKIFKDIVASVHPPTNFILDIGNKFYSLKHYQWAEKVFIAGAKELNNEYSFSFELGEVYSAMGDLTKMSAAIVSALQYGPGYLEQVKNAISTKLYDDENGKVKRVFTSTTLEFSQKNPNEYQYLELLIWLNLLDNNYDMAFIYSKSLDKRLNEDGKRLIELAQKARNSKNYDIATECYNYVIQNKATNYYYRIAKIQLVNVLQEKRAISTNLSPQDVIDLKLAYESAINEIGKNELTAQLIVDYAILLAFNANEYEKAMSLLEEIITNPRINVRDRASAKVQKADILVFNDDIWEAALLYGQVTSDFKNDPVGYEAKLKNAKAYYYTGDFDWAKTQLDVLKGGTTKFIANDAMILSVLISDNLGMDTSTTALQMYAKADLMYYQNKGENALVLLDSIVQMYPNHLSILDDVYLLQAKIHIKSNLYDEAIKKLEKVIDYDDLLQDDALMMLGELYEGPLQNKEKAMLTYEKLIVDFADSVYSSIARRRYRALRGDK